MASVGHLREMKSLMREKGGCLRKACLKVPTERTVNN